MTNWFWNSINRPHTLGWKMVCRIFGLITTQTSFLMVFCTNNELIGRNWWISLIFAPPVPFILLFFIFAFVLSLFPISFFFVLFDVTLFYLLSRSVYFIYFYFSFFVHSHFLLTYFLFLLMCFPLSSFLYLFNLVSISQLVPFKLRLSESIRVLKACKVSCDRSFWIFKATSFLENACLFYDRRPP
jgi:hypothetical protein